MLESSFVLFSRIQECTSTGCGEHFVDSLPGLFLRGHLDYPIMHKPDWATSGFHRENEVVVWRQNTECGWATTASGRACDTCAFPAMRVFRAHILLSVRLEEDSRTTTNSI